jgi:LysR family transcriptional regulator of gallate degradation
MIERVPNIRHLAALVATVRHGSVTRAARAVNLTQPALTQAIGGLEASLGITLFERSAAGMRPTVPAELLAPRVEAALAQIGSPRVTGTQLKAFVAVASAGSYAAASEASGLSAASLHRAVADLSVALGQRLVERRGRSIFLTVAGERRLRGFGLALAELRAGLAEVATWQGRAAGKIVIGAMPLSRARWLPEAIARFRAAHPVTDLVVIEGSHAELSGPLRAGGIDLMVGALREGPEGVDLAQQAVFVDRPKIVMRHDHQALSTPEGLGCMLEYPWILPGRNTPLRRYWEDMFKALGAQPPHVGIECGSVMTIRQLLLGSDALTLLSPDQVAVEVAAGLLAVCEPPVTVERTIGITIRSGWRPTAAQADFITILRQCGAASPN